jgi:hypothetical protein
VAASRLVNPNRPVRRVFGPGKGLSVRAMDKEYKTDSFNSDTRSTAPKLLVGVDADGQHSPTFGAIGCRWPCQRPRLHASAP